MNHPIIPFWLFALLLGGAFYGLLGYGVYAIGRGKELPGSRFDMMAASAIGSALARLKPILTWTVIVGIILAILAVGGILFVYWWPISILVLLGVVAVIWLVRAVGKVTRAADAYTSWANRN